MSKFDDLTDGEKIARLRLLTRASFQMAVASHAAIIARGLISPDEFSGMIQPVIDTLQEVAGIGDEEVCKMIDAFATMKSLAAQTWKG